MKKGIIYFILFMILGITPIFSQDEDNTKSNITTVDNRYNEDTWKINEVENTDMSIGNNIIMVVWHETNYNFDIIQCACKEIKNGITCVEIYLIALKDCTGKDFEEMLAKKISENNCTTIDNLANILTPILKDKFDLINQVIYDYGTRFDFIEK